MADPVLPNTYRAQWAWLGPSGLPKDRFVTTWAFQAKPGTLQEAMPGAISGALAEFWSVGAGGSAAVESFLSATAIAPSDNWELRIYNLGDPTPREPEIFTGDDIGITNQGLPNEVALCLSYYSVRNIPKWRGRVYIGPLASNTLAADPDLGDVRPTLSLRTSVVNSANRLMDRADVYWGLISQTDGQFRPISNVWVDDAFDTVRKRGVGATTRIGAEVD